MRKDIENKIRRFYKERLDYYKSLIEDAIIKADENEEIAALHRSINEIKALALQGKSTDASDAKYAELIKEYNAKLKAYLPTIKYECEKCKDKGVIGGKYCNCFLRRYSDELKKANNSCKLPNFTFDDNAIANSSLDSNIKDMYALIYDKVALFGEKYPNVKNRNIVIYGKSGSGKTCLVSALAHRLIDRNFRVEYITAFDLGEWMLKCHLDYKNNSLDLLTNSDILIIDDLGTEPMRKNINETYLQAILDSRIINNKSTIVTTNLNAEQLMAKYGERIVSRLMDSSMAMNVEALPNLRTTKH